MTKTLRGSVLFCLKEKKNENLSFVFEKSCHPGCLQSQEAGLTRASDPPIFIFQMLDLPRLSCFFAYKGLLLLKLKSICEVLLCGLKSDLPESCTRCGVKGPFGLLGKLVRSAGLKAPEDGPLFQRPLQY